VTDRERQMAAAIERAEAADVAEDEDVEYYRVPPPVDPSQVYSVRIPVSRLDQLRRIAAERGIRPSALMRVWVVERLEQETAPRREVEVVRVVYAPCSPATTRSKLDELDARIGDALAANNLTFGA
jgi:hypothetical protein